MIDIIGIINAHQEEIDELDRCKAAYALLLKLQKAEERAEAEGWIDADELEKELGVG